MSYTSRPAATSRRITRLSATSAPPVATTLTAATTPVADLRHLPLPGCEPLHELERLLGDLPPAGVDGQSMPAARHLDDLGHSRVALLLLVGRVRDRPGNCMVRVGRDDQHRAPLRVRRVDFRL